MARLMSHSVPAEFLAAALGLGAAAAVPADDAAKDLRVPELRMALEGPLRTRLDRIVHNWLIPAPDANPGMLEMMRLRDRQPPYESPVPWAGEFVGKYLTSCVLACRLSDDPHLHAVIARVMNDLIETQAEDGYLGPFPDEHLMGRWDLWGHYHCMLAMVLWHEDTRNTDALEAAGRAADLMCATFLDTGRRVHDAGSHEMNMAVIHVLGLLYRETGKEDYLRLMRDIEQDWQKPPAGDYFRLAGQGLDFYQIPKPRWESLHPMLGLAELFRITGQDTYRRALMHWWRSIRRTDVHNYGGFSTSERAVGNPFQSGAIETCCTVAWITLSVEALRLSGDSRIADALELATWNAVLAYQHPSGRWCTYDTPMDGKRQASAHSIVFQSRPGTPELNCCSVNGPNGLGQLARWAVLGGQNGLYVNYYGAGTAQATLENGSVWTFRQATRYPVEGTVDIDVHPEHRTALPLYLRIPEWSKETTVAVNGEPVRNIVPGTYLKCERTWAPGDRITLGLDLRLRALRGDHHVQFRTSLYRGPILLAFDQKHNAIDPDDMPELDLESLYLERLPEHAPGMRRHRLGPIVALSTEVNDRRVVLCDFASAGAYGTLYRSWLPVRNAPPAPFNLQYPEAGARLPLEEVCFGWSPTEPGSRYELRISRDPAFESVLLHETDILEPEFIWRPDAAEPGSYHWQVEAQQGNRRNAARNGPSSFDLDPSVDTSLHGTVVRASMAGTADPREGRLLACTDVAAATGRDGRDGGALAFNGTSSKLVYAAPRFPLHTYTFAAWIRPEGLGIDGRRWHQIVSAWCAPRNDPLRISVQDMELVVAVEQPDRVYRLSGGRLLNGTWGHVAAVKRYRDLILYVNGEETGRATVPASFQPGPRNVGIGCNPNYQSPEVFQGAIADVLFTREALTGKELARLTTKP